MPALPFQLLLLTAPFFAYRFTARGGNATAFRFALVLALAAVLLEHFSRTKTGAENRTRPSGGLLVPLWLFLFFCILQTLRSDYDIAVPILFVTVEGALTVTALVWYARTTERFAGLVTVYTLSAILPFLVGAYQVYGVVTTNDIPPLPLSGLLSSWLVPYDPERHGGIHLTVIEGLVFPRVASTLVDANFFGAYIASVLLCVMGRAAGLLLEAKKRVLPITVHTLAIALGLLVLLFTMSRSAWLGFAAGSIYVAYQATKRHRETARIRLAVLVTAAVSVALIWQVIVLTGFDLPILAFSRAQDFSGGIGIRQDLALDAATAFARNPIIGIGRANMIALTGQPTAHSFYLTRLAEDGLIGLVIVLVWIGIIWRRGASLVESDVTPRIRWIATGLRGGLAALLVANIPYDHMMSTEVNWVLLGLAAAAGRVVPPLVDSPPDGLEESGQAGVPESPA
jgi:hypothetical protein